MPEAMRTLVGNLQEWLGGAGFTLERRPFTPHVTLVRGAQCAAMPTPLAPIEWQVEQVVLVRSQLLPKGAQYQHLARWPLG
jgi:2'-5' RNA ligase